MLSARVVKYMSAVKLHPWPAKRDECEHNRAPSESAVDKNNEGGVKQASKQAQCKPQYQMLAVHAHCK